MKTYDLTTFAKRQAIGDVLHDLQLETLRINREIADMWKSSSAQMKARSHAEERIMDILELDDCEFEQDLSIYFEERPEL